MRAGQVRQYIAGRVVTGLMDALFHPLFLFDKTVGAEVYHYPLFGKVT